jgi:hypothetical protein
METTGLSATPHRQRAKRGRTSDTMAPPDTNGTKRRRVTRKAGKRGNGEKVEEEEDGNEVQSVMPVTLSRYNGPDGYIDEGNMPLEQNLNMIDDYQAIEDTTSLIDEVSTPTTLPDNMLDGLSGDNTLGGTEDLMPAATSKPISLMPEISKYLFSSEYEEIDEECFGCIYLSVKSNLGPIPRELASNLQEMVAACVYSGQTLQAARRVHDELESIRGEFNYRRPRGTTPYPEWPVWQIVRHLYLHSQDPVLQTYLQTQLATQHMYKIGIDMMYREVTMPDGTVEVVKDMESFKAYTMLQNMVLKIAATPAKKKNFHSPDSDRPAPNPFVGVPSTSLFNFYAGKANDKQ